MKRAQICIRIIDMIDYSNNFLLSFFCLKVIYDCHLSHLVVNTGGQGSNRFSNSIFTLALKVYWL